MAVEFTETVYLVDEGDGSVEVCVRLEPDSDLSTELTLQLQTHNGTALGNGICRYTSPIIINN